MKNYNGKLKINIFNFQITFFNHRDLVKYNVTCFASKGKRRCLPSTVLAKNAFQSLQNCLLLSFTKNLELHLKTDQPSLS